MSEQDAVQSSTKQRRSHKTSTANQQNGKQAPAAQRPANDDLEAWKAYWKAQGQPWRTEPEIDTERQTFLDERRKISPNVERGIYPFKDIKSKLTRSDIEWLLATHESGGMCGPVDWSDENQRQRKGLDLRGADLCQERLHHLPLACLAAGLDEPDWDRTTKGQRTIAAVLMKGADLQGAHLEGANLRKAHLEETFLVGAHLEKASLLSAHLEGANLKEAYLDGADLRGVFLDDGTYIQASSLGNEKLGFVFLSDIRWGDANLAAVKWSQVKMLGDEYEARQKKRAGEPKDRDTRLNEYEQAVRANRQLATALQNQGLNEDAARFAYRAQVFQRKRLWYQAFSKQEREKEKKQWYVTIWHRLASIGQSFRKFGSYIFLLFLDVLAGYGYKPGRSLCWYFFVIGSFAIMYSTFGHLPLLPDTLVLSLMSFHGRGFFPSLSGETTLHNPIVVLAAAEAVIGLLIEISFIATFTQRFFGK